jgi:hypothetical protein
MTMKPFADDTASTTIGELAAENGADVVTLSGSLEITRDKAGLKRAQALKALADAICQELEAGDLPSHVEVAAAKTEDVANPFA